MSDAAGVRVRCEGVVHIYPASGEGFDDVVQKAFRARVVIVSPSLLMLAVQVIQQIRRDARMREAADQIHAAILTQLALS